MARRYTSHMAGERYLANADPSSLKVHDLDQEKSRCQIDTIIGVGHDRPYHYLHAAKKEGYDNCAWCLGGSKR
jgi:hypothetical protein